MCASGGGRIKGEDAAEISDFVGDGRQETIMLWIDGGSAAEGKDWSSKCVSKAKIESAKGVPEGRI